MLPTTNFLRSGTATNSNKYKWLASGMCRLSSMILKSHSELAVGSCRVMASSCVSTPGKRMLYIEGTYEMVANGRALSGRAAAGSMPAGGGHD